MRARYLARNEAGTFVAGPRREEGILFDFISFGFTGCTLFTERELVEQVEIETRLR